MQALQNIAPQQLRTTGDSNVALQIPQERAATISSMPPVAAHGPSSPFSRCTYLSMQLADAKLLAVCPWPVACPPQAVGPECELQPLSEGCSVAQVREEHQGGQLHSVASNFGDSASNSILLANARPLLTSAR